MRNLLDNDRIPQVLSMSGNYRRLGALIDALNVPYNGSKQINSDIYEKYTLGRGHRIAQVQSVVVVGTLLQVTLADPNFDAILAGDIIVCKNTDLQGHVVSMSPGILNVQPSGTTLANLQGPNGISANNYVRSIGNVSEVKMSEAPGSLNEVPDVLTNRTHVRRSAHGYARRDRNVKSFPVYKDGFWSLAQVDNTITRHLKDDEYQMLLSQNTSYAYQGGGTVDRNGGLEWAIKNRGGVHHALTTAPTRTQFERFLMEMWDRKAGREGMLTLVMGRPFYHHISGFADDYVKYSGKNNTFFAEKGLNIGIFAVGGTEFNLVILPILNDRQFFVETSVAPGLTGVSMKGMTCYCFDFDPIQTEDNGMVAAIEHIHRGDSRWYAGWLKGIDKATFSGMSVEEFRAASAQVSTMTDGSQFGILSDCGIDTPGEYHGMMELIN